MDKEAIARSAVWNTQIIPGYNPTDYGNAERLVAQYGVLFHFCYEVKKFLVWVQTHWHWDDGACMMNLAKCAVRNIYGEASKEDDQKKREALGKHALSSESETKLSAMVELAKSEVGIPIKLDNLDADQWQLNCSNGTIDLKTGLHWNHNPEDLITRLLPIKYNPDAPCPLWLKFLDRVTGGDIELQSFLQRAVGYSLTGDTTMQILFFLYGLGNNGKSTFVTSIRKLLGEYAHRVSTDLFMVKEKVAGGPKESLANLRGKRFVVASELEDGRRLAVSLIKDLTGGESIRADRKYEHEIEYQPTYKLWLVGNHKPVITDTTLSIWRRMRLVPFTVTIPDTEIDTELPNKLEAEFEGILAWAVKGCLDWQKYGFNECQAVKTATQAYRHEQDILGDFIQDCCVLEEGATIYKGDLKEAYHNWCKDNSQEPVPQRTFRVRLTEKGISEGRIGKARYWVGIRLENVTESDRSFENLALDDKSDRNSYKVSTREEIQENFVENPVTSCHSKLNGQSLVTKISADNGSGYWQAFVTVVGCTREELVERWEAVGRPVVMVKPGQNVSDLAHYFERHAERLPAGHMRYIRDATKPWG